MAQQKRALAAKIGGLVWNPSIHLVGENLTLAGCPLTPPHQTHTQK